MLTIALIGRTNVGKSTLFNRIIGEAKAITSEIPHTTRDRNVGTMMWRGVNLRWIDTGGVVEINHPRQTEAGIEKEIRRQVLQATKDADALALVVDVREGLLPGERTIGRYLRTLGKPIVVVCNKVGNARDRLACAEFAPLGFGEAIPVAAITGMGVGDLLDVIVRIREKPSGTEGGRAQNANNGGTADVEKRTRVAIIGEPNVGKSSLLNAILGREEVIVLPEPFTTRDVHDVDLEWFPPQRSASEVDDERTGGRASPGPARGGDERPLRREGGTGGEPGGSPTIITLLDTAGIRRLAARAARSSRTRLEAIERLAVRRSLTTIERSDVVALVLDATRPATQHTKQLAQAIRDAGRACILVINKMDLMDESERVTPKETLRVPTGQTRRHAPTAAGSASETIHQLFPHLAWAPVVATSATEGTGVSDIIPAALRAATNWRRKITVETLAAVHGTAKRRIPIAKTAFGRKRSHLIELQQTDVAPPSFLLITRRRIKLPKAIPAIVERALREHADFAGTPIRITMKSMKV